MDNTKEIERLIALAETKGEETALDELVLDLVQDIGLSELNTLDDEDKQESHISSHELIGSDINNSGYQAQIEYLLNNGVKPETVEKELN